MTTGKLSFLLIIEILASKTFQVPKTKFDHSQILVSSISEIYLIIKSL